MEKRPVKVKDRITGKEYELVPIKVWRLSPNKKRGIKMGLFQNPETKIYFRARVPDDYPEY
jgi:hypothetical protein